MSGNTVIRINIKDDKWQSLKGKRFSEIKNNPGTIRWILSRPCKSGQLLEIANYIEKRDERRETSNDERARVVFMLSESGDASKTIVDAETVSDMVKHKGRSSALAGGLRCEFGHVMKFVDTHMCGESKVRPYFAHVTTSEATGGGGGKRDGGGGRCCDVHLFAQHCIVKHIEKISATRFKACGECTEFALHPTPGASATIEVSETTSDNRRIRSDVVVYKDGERHAAFEVKNTHATKDSAREGLPFLEVNAGHVITMLENYSGKRTVRLKCENSTTPCTAGCVQRRFEAERKRKRQYEEASWYLEECEACRDTGRMYACEDIYVPCAHCDRGSKIAKEEGYLNDDCDDCGGTGRMYGGGGVYIPCPVCGPLDDH